MQSIHCKTCGTNLELEKEVCRNCGAKTPRDETTKILALLFWGTTALLIALSFGGFFQHPLSHQAKNNNAAAAAAPSG